MKYINWKTELGDEFVEFYGCFMKKLYEEKKIEEFKLCNFNSYTISKLSGLDIEIEYLEIIGIQFPEFLVGIKLGFSRDVGGKLLHHAIKNNLQTTIDHLLTNSAIYDYEDEEGYNSLHIAAISGNEKLLKLLLEKSFPVTKTKSGTNPLHHAVMHGNIGCVKVLLEFTNSNRNSNCNLFESLKG